MSDEIDRIFEAYERGECSRRDVLARIARWVALGAGGVVSGGVLSAGARPAVAEPAPRPPAAPVEAPAGKPEAKATPRAHLNHLNLRVADVERAAAFYRRHFGLTLTSTETYHALDCGGGTFISLQTRADVDREPFRTGPGSKLWARMSRQPPGMIEHFCLEVEDFDLEGTKARLEAEGREVIEVAENLLTADPDGILLQVVDADLRFRHETREA